MAIWVGFQRWPCEHFGGDFHGGKNPVNMGFRGMVVNMVLNLGDDDDDDDDDDGGDDDDDGDG